MAGGIHVSIKKVREITYQGLKLMGVDDELAARSADTLTTADARGVDTHGIARLRFYDRAIENGEINLKPNIKIIKETPVSAYFDCDNGIGVGTADMVNDKAIELAKKNGIGFAVATGGHHFGAAGHYTLKAIAQDLIGMSAQPSQPLAAPTGGTKRLIGNSPNSLAFPAGYKTLPMMLDMASTTVAGGKVEMAIRKGIKMPMDWALDSEGNPTDDPFKVINPNVQPSIVGTLTPMAGPKGYCMIVIFELLAGVLPKAEVGEAVLASGRTSGTGYYFIAIDPTIIRPLDEMKRDLDEYFLTIKNSPRREGVDEIFLPGEIEHKIAADRKDNGYMLMEAVANEALDIFKKYKAIDANATIEDLFKE